MTLAQIEKIRAILEALEKAKQNLDVDVVMNIDDDLYHFFDKEYNSPHLECREYRYGNSEISNEDILNDINRIEAILKGMLAKDDNNEIINNILDFIKQGEQSIDNKQAREKFLSKVYYAFSDKIKFDETIKAAAVAPADMLSIGFINVDKNMINGVLFQLRQYAITLINSKNRGNNDPSKGTTAIDFHPTINTSTTVTNNIDISISIKQARQQVEDAGLADDQHKAVMDKLNEIEKIAKSKDSNGKRWMKAKEILKWVAEQGITVAGIILPLLAPMIG